MSVDPIFDAECEDNIRKMSVDFELKEIAKCYHDKLAEHHYAHNFTWMGVPILQEPTDIMMWQELVMRVKPELIIETGIARGGSIMLSASLLALLDIEDYRERAVIGIDIEIRKHTYNGLSQHYELYNDMIMLVESSSRDITTVNLIKQLASLKTTMVALDSDHTHEHVLAELEAYAPLVTVGSYIVVFDTGLEFVPKDHMGSRQWGPGNSPMTAVNEFLKTHPEFEQDLDIDRKLIITSAPGGWLRRIK